MDSNDTALLAVIAKKLRELRADFVGLSKQPGPAGRDGTPIGPASLIRVVMSIGSISRRNASTGCCGDISTTRPLIGIDTDTTR